MGEATETRATFGVARLGGRLIPHPDEAPVVRLVYDLFILHRRKKTVARLLNEQGHRTRSGAPFTDTSIGRLLRDPIAREAGVVTSDIWEQVSAILAQQTERGSVGRSVRHLLSGLVRCGCGELMYPKGKGGKYLCRACARKIPIDDLEAVVAHELADPSLALGSIDTAWPHLSFEEKRSIIELAVSEVVIGNTIELNLAL